MNQFVMQVVFINKRTHLLLTGTSWKDKDSCYRAFNKIESPLKEFEELILLEIVDPSSKIIAIKLIDRQTAESLLVLDNYSFETSVQQAIKHKRLAGNDRERMVLLDRKAED